MNEQSVQNWKELKQIKSSLIEQYVEFKEKYPDHIIFLQVGKFYEIYAQDAIITTEVIKGTELTQRLVQGKVIPMCGFPEHTGENAANRLARQNHHVLLIGQRKNENEEVVREIQKFITPSTMTNDEYFEQDENIYIMTAYAFKDEVGVALLDTLSGEFMTRNINKYSIFDMVTRYKPKEIRLYLWRKWENELMQKLEQIPEMKIFEVPAYHEMKSVIEIHKQKYFSDTFVSYGIIAAHYFLLEYLNMIQPQHVTLRPIQHVENRDYLYLHANAIAGLDLLENSQTREKKGSLFDLMDKCTTPKGTRLLKKWIQEPLLDEKKIQARYQAVEYFISHEKERTSLQEILMKTTDMERMLSRLETGRFRDTDFTQLVENLQHYQQFLEQLSLFSISWMKQNACKLMEQLTPFLQDLQKKVDIPDIIAEKYDPYFDQIRQTKIQGYRWIEEYVEEEKKQTKIKTLKLEQNKTLGYFFEVTKSQLSLVPDYFIEKGKENSAGKTKYVTEKLVELEQSYMESIEKYDRLYRQILKKIADEITPEHHFLRSLVDFVALMDILMGFAVIAIRYHYQKPTLISEEQIQIQQGKHPLLQSFSYTKVVKNDCQLNVHDILLVTGPNAGGKSTYLKMNALLLIMAQMGSFVPAKLIFKPVDRILLRAGANDYLLNHQSTFMMEMDEVAYILYHATPQSLILMDELGRGTSTQDGLSIAHAIIEYLHDEIKCKTICSTHYHELSELEHEFSHVSNVHAEAIEKEDGIHLTYKIKTGAGSKSFGIHVAQKAGIPLKIIQRAEQLLQQKYIS